MPVFFLVNILTTSIVLTNINLETVGGHFGTFPWSSSAEIYDGHRIGQSKYCERMASIAGTTADNLDPTTY